MGAGGPAGLFMTEPHWKNFFENALTVQFNHRLMAYGILAYVLWMARRVPRTWWFVAAAVLAQMLLGILTVVWNVPLAVALIHQGGALVLLALALWHLHPGCCRNRCNCVLLRSCPDQVMA